MTSQGSPFPISLLTIIIAATLAFSACSVSGFPTAVGPTGDTTPQVDVEDPGVQVEAPIQPPTETPVQEQEAVVEPSPTLIPAATVTVRETVEESEPDPVAVERPDWQNVQLIDVRTDEAFTLASFDGQVVILETMAVWCPLCDQQQLEINAARSKFGDEVVVVSLGVDPDETAEIVAAHANQFGLPWRFAIAGSELVGMLQIEFGPQILAPPSTPIVIIGPDGSFELTQYGIKSAGALVDLTNSLLP